MAITQEQFDTLIKKLEDLSKSHPRAYRLRVALFALLGYTYIFLILSILLILFGSIGSAIFIVIFFGHFINAVVLKYALILLASVAIPATVIIRSLWVTFPSPRGLRLNRKQSPYLFTLVDELTTKLQAPRFHNILLTPDFNAAVIQIPRLGIFGWQNNYLLLGLPLMQALSLEQLKAVLAHELGHLSGNHSRFSAWIYRIRKTWMQIYERLHQNDQHGSSVLFNHFLNWYWPAFNAYSFVLGRTNEYEADRCAAQLTGNKNTAEALINVEVKSRFLESSFWIDIYEQTKYQADPPSNIYSSMVKALHDPLGEGKINQLMGRALVKETDNIDTHPCLADRLKSLDYRTAQIQNFSQLVTIQVSAAESLLGESLQHFTQEFDRDWKEATSTSWRQRYAYFQETQNKLQSLEQNTQILNEQEIWERAYYTLELRGKEAAIPLLQDILKIQPNHADANYVFGRILLGEADVEGVVYVERAIEQKVNWVIDGCGLIADFFYHQGQPKEAKKYLERAEKHYQLLLKAQQERIGVYDTDSFKPHTLEESDVSKLNQEIADYSQVEEAYLVQKVVNYFPKESFFVLGIIRKQFRKHGLNENDEISQKLAELLAKKLQFSFPTYIIILNHSRNNILRKKICKTDKSLIFRRSPSKK
jgi:Zn-dependent protease with chaperone function